jgi:CheY-like chemotaxis protein
MVSHPRPRFRRSILVVDDDAMVAVTIGRVFSRESEVTVATSARKALELLLAGDRFDAIVCDLMMPQMTGMDLFAELVRVRPELCPRIVFLSGGAFTPEARAFLERIPNARLEKPFVPTNLRAVVHGVMQPASRTQTG